MRHAADRAAALTSQLLAFSRRQPQRLKPLELNQAICKLEKMLTRVIGVDVKLRTVLPAGGLVMADESQFEQVIMNLVVNARDAMPHGGTVTIETTTVEFDAAKALQHAGALPGTYIEVSVSDTGLGIAPDILSQIFEPFFTTKEIGKGTGLGLSTVYGIVKQSGGFVTVESTVGVGTTFRVYLPRTAGVEAPVAVVFAAVRSSSPGGETVLLVDDEPVLRRVVKRALTAAGYVVLTAEDGEDALRVSSEHPGPIELLLTDIAMPRMSGPVLAERLRGPRPETRVLFMSGYADASAGALTTAGQILAKPFAPDELLLKVRAELDHAVPALA